MTAKRVEASSRRGASSTAGLSGREIPPEMPGRNAERCSHQETTHMLALLLVNPRFLGIYPEGAEDLRPHKGLHMASTAVSLIMTPTWKSPRRP